MSNVTMKVYFLGDPKVGKTALCKYLRGNQFTDEYTPSYGFNFVTYKGNDRTLQIFDHSNNRSPLLYGTSCFVIFFDRNDRKTFDNLELWMSEVEVYNPSETILVSTKSDLPDAEVSKEEALSYASKKRILFFEISAKTGENVKELMIEIEKSYRPPSTCMCGGKCRHWTPPPERPSLF